MTTPTYFTPRMIAEASGVDYMAILQRIRKRANEGVVPPCLRGRAQSLYTYDEVKLILRDNRRRTYAPRHQDITEDDTQLRIRMLRRQLIVDGFNVR